jgi:1-aminocyclopropane-1-carboxylate deaminase
MISSLQPACELTPMQEIDHPLLDEHGLSLHVKRDDLIHPLVSGNKWRKLKYNLRHAQQQNISTLLTFGGAYSNHIYAFSAASKMLGFKAVAVIRGEESDKLSPTLLYAREQGVHLHFVSRQDYRRRNDEDFIACLRKKFGDVYLIPEGGSNALAVKGVRELVQEMNQQLPRPFDVVCTAVGSGGTMAGLISGLASEQEALGIAVLKNAQFLRDDVRQLLSADNHNWNIMLDYHCGGYARFNEQLIDFIVDFKARTDIPLEPIYTGKMMFALFDQIQSGRFRAGQSLVALHTGGLQGLLGIRQRFPRVGARL